MSSLRLLRRTGRLGWPVRSFCLLPPILFTSLLGLEGARTRGRVSDSILGVRVGSSLAEARARLEPLAVRREEPEDDGRSEPRAERTKAWTLKDSEYQSVALKLDDADRVIWITGFVRPGREIPFKRLGELSIATRATDSMAVWNVATRRGPYRLVARGWNRRARVISILSLVSLRPPDRGRSTGHADD